MIVWRSHVMQMTAMSTFFSWFFSLVSPLRLWESCFLAHSSLTLTIYFVKLNQMLWKELPFASMSLWTSCSQHPTPLACRCEKFYSILACMCTMSCRAWHLYVYIIGLYTLIEGVFDLVFIFPPIFVFWHLFFCRFHCWSSIGLVALFQSLYSPTQQFL